MFRDALVIIFPHSQYVAIEIQLMFDDTFKQGLEKLLRDFDTGIDGVDFQVIDFDDELDVPTSVKDDIRKELYSQRNQNLVIVVPDHKDNKHIVTLDENQDISASKLMTLHQTISEGRPVRLEINEESDGTQRLFDIIPMFLELTRGNKVFVIDEIGRSLHPDLAYKIMEIFFNSAQAQSQLVVTTHEDRLLNFDLMRRDEFWFVQKDKHGISELYSLEEFDLRNDKKIRRGYQQGRYGGVPLLQPSPLKPIVE